MDTGYLDSFRQRGAGPHLALTFKTKGHIDEQGTVTILTHRVTNGHIDNSKHKIRTGHIDNPKHIREPLRINN